MSTLSVDAHPKAVAALVAAAGATLLDAWPLAGGVSAQMTALAVRLPDGSPATWVLRRPASPGADPRALRREVAVLRCVAAAGLPVPTPRWLDESGAHLPGPALLLDYLQGAPCFDPTQGARVAQALGELLATLHRAALTGADLPDLPRYRLPPPRPTLDHSLGEAALRAALANAWPPAPTLPAPILLHGDAWPGNLLWQGDRLVALIDWEDALLGDPLADLAVSRLDVAWLFGEAAMQRLTAAYVAATGFDLAALPVWDLAAALRPCGNLPVWAAGWPALGRSDLTLAAMTAVHARFVAQACAALPPGRAQGT